MSLPQNLSLKHNIKHRGRFLTCCYSWRHTYTHRCCDWKGWCQLGVWVSLHDFIAFYRHLVISHPQSSLTLVLYAFCCAQWKTASIKPCIQNNHVLYLKNKLIITNKSVSHLFANCTALKHVTGDIIYETAWQIVLRIYALSYKIAERWNKNYVRTHA